MSVIRSLTKHLNPTMRLMLSRDLHVLTLWRLLRDERKTTNTPGYRSTIYNCCHIRRISTLKQHKLYLCLAFFLSKPLVTPIKTSFPLQLYHQSFEHFTIATSVKKWNTYLELYYL